MGKITLGIFLITAITTNVLGQLQYPNAPPNTPPARYDSQSFNPVDKRNHNLRDAQQSDPFFKNTDYSNYQQGNKYVPEPEPENVVKAIDQSRRPQQSNNRQKPNRTPSKPNRKTEKPPPQQPLSEAEGTREFAWNLFKASNSPSKNLIISPISVQTLLKGLEEAAGSKLKADLQSRIRSNNEDLSNYLESLVNGDQNSANKINIATAYFIANDFQLNAKYARNRLLNNIDMLPIDVHNPTEASEQVNAWVSEKTHRTINRVLNAEDVNAALRLLLINAIHFKGQWRHKFANTTEAEYEIAPGAPKLVPQMYQFNKLRSDDIISNDNDQNSIGQWVELPYDGDKLGMVIMLPRERHQLDTMIERMTPGHLQRIYDEIKDGYVMTKVHVKLPRFRIKGSVSLNEPLKKLGLQSLFEQNAIDKLSNEATRVSEAKQQADISVDENGTVASAVTSLNIITLSIHPTYKIVNFTVDQPFLGMIVDKENGVPLFIFKAVDI